MSVQSELTRLSQAAGAIGEAIESKGVTVPEGTKLDGMAGLIGNIEVTDLSGVTAAAENVLDDKFFVTSAGVLTEGTMPLRVTGQAANSCVLRDETLYYRLPHGCWPNTYSDTECEAGMGQAAVAEAIDLTEDKLVSGKTVLGVEGSGGGKIPLFTYTGSYKIVDDTDNAAVGDLQNWKVRFLTSGTLVFISPNSAKAGIDVFCVGGGGGGSSAGSYAVGGGGGYTKSFGNVQIVPNEPIAVTVGAGGAQNTAGGKSSFGTDCMANGGGAGGKNSGGNGGSGGANVNGTGATNGGSAYGSGQGYSTKEFYELDGNAEARLYASGGSGANKSAVAPTGANTGTGGCIRESGYSGIVIIRNKRG